MVRCTFRQILSPVANSGVIFLLSIISGFAQRPPAPVISRLDPESVAAGGPNFLLTVYGLNFLEGDGILWDNGLIIDLVGGNPVRFFPQPMRLEVTIGSHFVAAEGEHQIVVVHQNNDRSAPATFRVGRSAAAITVSFSFELGARPPNPRSVPITGFPTGTPLTVQTPPLTPRQWLSVQPLSGVAPLTLTLTANPQGLSAGTYRATVIVRRASPEGASTERTVNVVFTVAAARTLLVPRVLSFRFGTSGGTPSSRFLSVTTRDGAPRTFSYVAETAAGGTWLTVSANRNITPATLTVTVDPSRIAGNGVFLARIRTCIPSCGVGPRPLVVGGTSSGSQEETQTVIFVSAQSLSLVAPGDTRMTVYGTVSGSVQRLSRCLWISDSSDPPPAGDEFSTGADCNGYQRVRSLQNPGLLVYADRPTRFRASLVTAFEDWLSAKLEQAAAPVPALPLSVEGETEKPVLLTLNLPALPTLQRAELQFAPTAGVSPHSVALLAVDPGEPFVQPATSSLTFSHNSGEAAPPPQQVPVYSSSGNVPYSANVLPGAPWLNSSSTGGAVTISVNPSNLMAGTHSGTVELVSSAAAESSVIGVVLNVLGGGSRLVVSPSSLEVDVIQGAPSVTRTLTINSQTNFSVALSSSQTWLTVTPGNLSAGVNPMAATITVNPAGLPPGAYSGMITLSAPNASNTPVIIPVTLRVSDRVPQITGVINAASLEPGVTANGWIAVMGSDLTLSSPPRTWRPDEIPNGVLPQAIEDVRVWINNRPGYIWYVSPGQINVLTPADDTTGAVRVETTRNGVPSNVFLTNMRTHQPGLFLKWGSHVAATHLTGVVVGDQEFPPESGTVAPAQPGEIIAVYGTGLGPVDPTPVSGVLTPASGLYRTRTLPVVRIGGVQADVLFSGLTPTQPSLYQINVRVPLLAPDGRLPIVVEVGGVTSPNTAVISVRR